MKMKWWKRLLKMLEKGVLRQQYNDLYVAGAITTEEFLRLVKEIDDE